MADPSDRARLVSRTIGLVASASLLLAYAWLLWSMTKATNSLHTTEQEVTQLEAREKELRQQIATGTKKRKALEQKVADLTAQIATKKSELSAVEQTQRNLQVAAENASPGEVQEQVLGAMRAKSRKQRSDALYTAGRLAREQKQTARAEKLFEAAVSEYESAPALNALGRLLADTNRIAAAEQLFGRSMRADPRYVYPLHNMSHLMMQQGRKDEARKYAERALAVDPEYAPAKEILKRLSSGVTPEGP